MERDEEGVNKIRFSFYEKPMASEFVIMKNSGLSWQTKRSALSGEVARRRLNMDDKAWEEEGVSLIEKLNLKMLNSGYTEYERGVFVKEGLARYNNILEKVMRGERPLYRLSSWKKMERSIQKKVKARTWYGNVETVLFVQPTLGELLRKQIQELANTTEFKIKVVECGGRTIKSMLQKSVSSQTRSARMRNVQFV